MVGRRRLGPRSARRAAVRASGAERPVGRWGSSSTTSSRRGRRPSSRRSSGCRRRHSSSCSIATPWRRAHQAFEVAAAPRPAGSSLQRSPHRRRAVTRRLRHDESPPIASTADHEHRHPGHCAGRLTRRRPDPRGAARLGTWTSGCARRWAGILRRRSARVRGGPASQRGDLIAACGDRPAPRVRLARRGRRPARGWRGGGARRPRRDLPRRVGHADERVRAQPRHPAGTRARRRLLAAHDKPLPRGAGRARRARGGRARCGPRDGRHRRPRSVFSA